MGCARACCSSPTPQRRRTGAVRRRSPGLAYQDLGAGIAYVGTATAESVGIGRRADGDPRADRAASVQLRRGRQPRATCSPCSARCPRRCRIRWPIMPPPARRRWADIDAGLEKITTAQTIVGSRMGWIEIIDERRLMTGELRCRRARRDRRRRSRHDHDPPAGSHDRARGQPGELRAPR